MRREGDTAIIYVRGPLEHHDEGWGCSYEGLISDMKCAWEGDEENEPAKRVVMCVDSPGGVVSGLYECVDTLRKIKKGKLIVSVEGLCASAAYALACSADEIIASRSSILGSVGVIATMYSQKRRDDKEGFDFLTITSGKRKADGHPHVAISKDAVSAEDKRVKKFAQGFFDMVWDARGFDPEPAQAGLFVGKDAVSAGFADKIGTLDKLLAQLGTDVAQSGTGVQNMRPSALIKATKTALKSAKTEAEKTRLRLALAALTADTKKTYEHEKEVEETTDEPEEEEEESSEDDGEEEEEDGGNETDREEESDEPDDDAESEEDDKKASAALKGLKGKGKQIVERALAAARAQRTAMRGELKEHRKNAAAIAELRAENDKRDRNAVIDSAVSAGRVTPGEAKKLRKMSTIEVGAFLAARPNAIVKPNLGPDLKSQPSLISQAMGNVAPNEVTAEITAEMREAAERVTQLSSGLIKTEDFIKQFQASATAPKETH